MDLKQFLHRCRISERDFKLTDLSWPQLLEIRNDCLNRIEKMHGLAVSVASLLMKAKGVHSVKNGIKESDHLIEKIIRKNTKKRSSALPAQITVRKSKILSESGCSIYSRRIGEACMTTLLINSRLL
ncbi:hypothetical protein ACFL5V_06015 [Fibrobacterota bacterium]